MSRRSTAPLLFAVVVAVTWGCADRTTAPPSASPAPLQPVPLEIDLRPERQHCVESGDCAIVAAAPGDGWIAGCCATCLPPRALTRDRAALVDRWVDELDCGAITCPPLGDGCLERTPMTAVCRAGRCVVKPR